MTENANMELFEEANLMCDALVREINRANNWQSIVEAVNAIKYIRLRQTNMENERSLQTHLSAVGQRSADD